jgi:hypothetical protein
VVCHRHRWACCSWTNREVNVWENPLWSDPTRAIPALFEQTDILAANVQHWLERGPAYRQFFTDRRDAGCALWLYACLGPARLLDPYRYYRALPWWCWTAGASGLCYWSFIDTSGASSWNEYVVGGAGYSPLFLDNASVTQGKAMQAIREGVQDYECLRMLAERAAARRAAGGSDEVLEAAVTVLAAGPDRVLSGMHSLADLWWRGDHDRSAADEVRREALDALLALDGDSDADGDGARNRDEAGAGTDALDPASLLRIISLRIRPRP